MARALRIEIPGGRNHATARGTERKDILWGDSDRFHFLELLGEVTQPFGARVHASVLMSNHCYLLVKTPEANLSLAMQWLKGSYGVWFNRRHQGDGHLLQGRFQCFPVKDGAGWQGVARYVHLNPVRPKRPRLDKSARAASHAGLPEPPTAELVAERLAELRQFRWSSYRGYAGYATRLAWVWLGRGVGRLRLADLGQLAGGLDYANASEAVTRFTRRLGEDPGLRQGVTAIEHQLSNDKI